MKKLLPFLFLLTAFVLVQCAENEPISNGSISFSFERPANFDAGTDASPPTLIVSVSDRNGKSVLLFSEVETRQEGSTITSSPIELPPGNYTVDDLIVVRNTEILLITPKDGSPMESSVVHALPVPFNVRDNTDETFQMQVVGIDSRNPSDFGYASFMPKVVHPFSVNVFVFEDGKLRLTNAKLSLENEQSSLFEFSLSPRVNILSFPGDHNADYKLRISKEGYQDYELNFNYRDYLSEYGNRAIAVILEVERGVTLSVSNEALFYLTMGQSGSIFVNWPDGEVTEIAFSNASSGPDQLTFEQVFRMLPQEMADVTLSGDLDKIVEFVAVSPTYGLDIQGLTNLKTLTLENASLDHLDLSENTQLSSLGFVYSSITDITIPSSHRIDNVLVEGTVDLEFPLDDLISHVHANAVRENLMEGAFIIFNAGDISPSSEEKLTELSEEYNWYIELE